MQQILTEWTGCDTTGGWLSPLHDTHRYPDCIFVAVLYTSDSDKMMRYTDEVGGHVMDISRISLTYSSWRAKRWSSVDGLLIWVLCPHSCRMRAYRSQMGFSQVCGCSRFWKTCADACSQNLNWVWRLIVLRSEVFYFTRDRNGAELSSIFSIDWHGDCE